MANRPVTILVKKKQTTGGSIPGSALMGEPFVNLFDGVLKFSATTGGSFEPSSQTNVFEVGSALYNQKISNRLNINDNFIISGNTGIISTYAGTSSLANKFLSGTSTGFVVANIADIAASTDSYTTGATWVPNTLTLKLNQSKPDVTVVIDTFNTLTVTGSTSLATLSATTMISGSTNLYSIFEPLGAGVQTVGQGSNITTGGTVNNPTINVVASPSFNALTASGATSLATLSATTMISGSTNLYNIFSQLSTSVQSVGANGNLTTGGTATNPTINLAASPSFSNITFSGTATGGALSATSISAATSIYSAGTSLETIIYNIASATENITSIGNGLNTYTGGTQNVPTVNVSAATLASLTVSGATSLATLSATTMISGSTNLYNIFSQLSTSVQSVGANGNLSTGGTATNPTINLAASPSFNNITFSGTATGGDLYAVNLSGGSIFSGSTNLNTYFGTINSQLSTKANLSGATFTGAISATAITDTALTSGWAVYAGSGGLLKTTSGFTYDDVAKRLYSENIQIGTPSLSGTVDIWGDVVVHGQSISAFTSQLYVEDNNIILNYNPTASTTSTSLGAGLTIQDGDGLASGDVFWDIRGTATGVANRGFATNLNDIYIRESGTTSSPGGVRVLAELDVLDGGQY